MTVFTRATLYERGTFIIIINYLLLQCLLGVDIVDWATERAGSQFVKAYLTYAHSGNVLHGQ